MSLPDQFQNPASSQTASQSEDHIIVDTPELIALELPLAGVGSRFMAMALDTLIQGALYIAGIFAMAAAERYGRIFSFWFNWIPASWGAALLILFLFCLYWGYFAFFEAVWKGRTPGKRVAGIRVIKDSGRALNIYEIIGRNLMRAVDALPFFYVVGIVSVMVTRRNQRLGDLLAGSIVVHDKPVEGIRPDWSPTAEKTAASPELSKVAPEELVLIETYLQRRASLDFAVRDATANRIATRITAKTGIERPRDQSLDDFLEGIAKQMRESASFRPS